VVVVGVDQGAVHVEDDGVDGQRPGGHAALCPAPPDLMPPDLLSEVGRCA
jgi:hypothetical protein